VRTRWWLGLAVGVAALVAVTRLVGVGLLAGAARSLGWCFAILCAVQVFTLLLDATALRLAVPRSEPGTLGLGRALSACLAALAVNSATPLGQAGELVKGRLLRAQLSTEGAVAAVWLHNQMMFLTSAVLFATAPLAAALAAGAPRWALRLALAMTALYGMAALLAAVLLAGGLPLRWLAARWPSTTTRARLVRACQLARLARARELGRRRLAAALALTALKRLVHPLEAVLILWWLGHGPDWSAAFFSQPATQALAGLASFAPLGLGTTEPAAWALFRGLGRAAELGVVIELARDARRLLFVGLGLAGLGWRALGARAQGPISAPGTAATASGPSSPAKCPLPGMS
jgi:hypothetical protein